MAYPYEELLGVASDPKCRRLLRDDAVAVLDRARTSLDGADVVTCAIAGP